MSEAVRKFSFTEDRLDRLPIPTRAEAGTAGYVLYYDEEFDGLGLAVRPSGVRTFFLRYTTEAGRERRLKLGRFPALRVADARRAARLRAGEIALGGDPVAARKAIRQAKTVDELLGMYLAEHIEPHRSEHSARSVRRVRVLVKPTIGHLLVHECTIPLVNATLARFERQVGNYNLIGTYVRAAFDWGRQHGKVPQSVENPAEFFEPKPTTPQARVITAAEYRKILTAVDELMRHRRNDPARLLACLWVCYTGCRPVEAVRLKRSYVLRERGVAELWEHKTVDRTKEPKRFFLDEHLLGILDQAEALHKLRKETSEFVFPRRANQKPSNWLAKTWTCVRAKAGVDIDLRQLRSGYINAADDAGIGDQELANTTGHLSVQTIRRNYKILHRQKAEKTHRRISALIHGAKTSNVVNLSEVAAAMAKKPAA